MIEESDSDLYPFELKWNKNKIRNSTLAFQKEYGAKPTQIVNKDTFIDFVR